VLVVASELAADGELATSRCGRMVLSMLSISMAAHPLLLLLLPTPLFCFVLQAMRRQEKG
jgi:hypothetical protein